LWRSFAVSRMDGVFFLTAKSEVTTRDGW